MGRSLINRLYRLSHFRIQVECLNVEICRFADFFQLKDYTINSLTLGSSSSLKLGRDLLSTGINISTQIKGSYIFAAALEQLPQIPAEAMLVVGDNPDRCDCDRGQPTGSPRLGCCVAA